MSEKRAIRKEERITNPTRIGGFDFSIGDTDAMMKAIAAKGDNVMSFGPWAIYAEVGVGISVSFNGSTIAQHMWVGLQEAYYFIKDLILATWEKMKEAWTWFLGLFSKETKATVVAAKDTVAKAVDTVVEVVSSKKK